MEILALVFLVLCAALFALYASIIKRRNKALEAFSGVDVQLRRRHNVIPNVLEIAKRYMTHERELLDGITKLRTQAVELSEHKDSADPAQRFEVENQLQSMLGQLRIQVENYPELKADQTMMRAMDAYTDTEDQIAAARRFYNAAAGALRNSIQIFPGNLIAGMIGVAEMPFYEADEISRQPVSAKDYFG